MNDTNNDNKTRFSITTQGLYFHNRIDTLRHLTTSPDIGLRLAVQKVRCAAQTSDIKTAETYNLLSEHSHRVTITFYAQCEAFRKANGYLPICDSDKFTEQ
jgi:hypothetical protein